MDGQLLSETFVELTDTMVAGFDVIDGNGSVLAKVYLDGDFAAPILTRQLAAAQARCPEVEFVVTDAAGKPVQGAIVVLDVKSGDIRALVGGSDYDRSAFDRTSSMRRQPGSAFPLRRVHRTAP